jgi:hypothetical protein
MARFRAQSREESLCRTENWLSRYNARRHAQATAIGPQPDVLENAREWSHRSERCFWLSQALDRC